MKRYLFIRELPLYDFIALQDYLNNLFPEIEIQAITYNSVKIDGVQKYEVILETQNNIDDNSYINIGLLIDDFESELSNSKLIDLNAEENEVEVIDKITIYKSLNEFDKQAILSSISIDQMV